MKKKALILVAVTAVLAVFGFLFRSRLMPAVGATQVQHGRMATVVLPVHGMTCESCQNTVTQGLLKLPGVSSVTVNLQAETATVAYDAEAVIVQSMVETIAALGYRSQVPTDNRLEVIDFKVDINN